MKAFACALLLAPLAGLAGCDSAAMKKLGFGPAKPTYAAGSPQDKIRGLWTCTIQEGTGGVSQFEASFLSDDKYQMIGVWKGDKDGKTAVANQIFRGDWKIENGVLVTTKTYAAVTSATLGGETMDHGRMNAAMQPRMLGDDKDYKVAHDKIGELTDAHMTLSDDAHHSKSDCVKRKT